MEVSLVMTVIGPDRPGLVDSLASLIAGHKGNWLESRMSRLGGQFAGILRVQIPAEAEAGLVKALEGLEFQGLTVVVHRDRAEGSLKAGLQAQALLEVVGQDRPGIVQKISHVLASRGVNVEELHTECASAAMSGETLFKARAKLSLPQACDLTQLRKQLERIADDLIVEINLEELSEGCP